MNSDTNSSQESKYILLLSADTLILVVPVRVTKILLGEKLIALKIVNVSLHLVFHDLLFSLSIHCHFHQVILNKVLKFRSEN
jgi:hypothetical protein